MFKPFGFYALWAQHSIIFVSRLILIVYDKLQEPCRHYHEP
jgi:hypothetical protein